MASSYRQGRYLENPIPLRPLLLQLLLHALLLLLLFLPGIMLQVLQHGPQCTLATPAEVPTRHPCCCSCRPPWWAHAAADRGSVLQ
jgi:hypothetical protein